MVSQSVSSTTPHFPRIQVSAGPYHPSPKRLYLASQPSWAGQERDCKRLGENAKFLIPQEVEMPTWKWKWGQTSYSVLSTSSHPRKVISFRSLESPLTPNFWLEPQHNRIGVPDNRILRSPTSSAFLHLNNPICNAPLSNNPVSFPETHISALVPIQHHPTQTISASQGIVKISRTWIP